MRTKSIIAKGGLLLAIAVAALNLRQAQAIELPVEGGSGGGPFKTDCSGDFVVGVYLRSGAWIDAIGLKCAPFDPTRRKFKHPPWNKAFSGGPGGAEQEAICPDDRYVSGLRFNYTLNPDDRTKVDYVDFVEITCTSIAGASSKQCLQTGETCWSGRVTTNFPGGFSVDVREADQKCPEGEAATGIHGRSGKYLDALGLICGPTPWTPFGGVGGVGDKIITKSPGDVIAEPPILGGAAPGGKVITKIPGDVVADPTPAAPPPPPPPPPPPSTCAIKRDSDIYAAPGGAKIGFLAANTPGVTLLARQGTEWFNLKWPAGQGWGFSGPGYPDAIACP